MTDTAPMAMTKERLEEIRRLLNETAPDTWPVPRKRDGLAEDHTGTLLEVFNALRTRALAAEASAAQVRAELETFRNLAERHAVTCPFAPEQPELEIYACSECLAQGDTRQDVIHEERCPFHRAPAEGERR